MTKHPPPITSPNALGIYDGQDRSWRRFPSGAWNFARGLEHGVEGAEAFAIRVEGKELSILADDGAGASDYLMWMIESISAEAAEQLAQGDAKRTKRAAEQGEHQIEEAHRARREGRWP